MTAAVHILPVHYIIMMLRLVTLTFSRTKLIKVCSANILTYFVLLKDDV